MILVIIIIIIALFLYVWICWRKQLKFNHMLYDRNNLDVINLGSTYAFYDIDYKYIPKKGLNLANVPQYLDYDYIILKKYIKYLKKNSGKVLIVLPDFVFCGKNTQSNRKIYYEALSYKEISDYKITQLLFFIWMAVKEPFTNYYAKQREKWKGYKATVIEKERHAEKRKADWENVIGIPSVNSSLITEELSNLLEQNKKRVYQIIELCNIYNVTPIIIIPPVSAIQKKHVSETCLQKYLMEPIFEIQKNTKVKILDYLHLDVYDNPELYLNSDCLNEDGVKRFMKNLYLDIWEKDEEDSNSKCTLE